MLTKAPVLPRSDPLSATSGSEQPSPAAPSSAARDRYTPHSRSVTSSPTPGAREGRLKNFAFLLRPEIYHSLTPLNVPPAFRNSAKQLGPETPIEELLDKGLFRAAAIAAVQELTSSGASGGVDPTDHQRIFSLLYTRLSCLVLVDATALAAQEVKALEDLNSTRTYVDDKTGEHLVPWKLRVLNVRLQSLGFGDPRRAVMSYYELGREARDHLIKASTTAKSEDGSQSDEIGAVIEMWKARLHELGIRVADALIEMNDLSGAAHHLGTLSDLGDGKLALARALLWLQVGDADEARRCAEHVSTTGKRETTEKLIAALSDMADANYDGALQHWDELETRLGGADEMVGVNKAVCLLYLGRMADGRETLEGLVSNGCSSHTLLFNLSTMYELCTEKNRSLKTGLSERVAALDGSTSGWEKTNVDFKL